MQLIITSDIDVSSVNLIFEYITSSFKYILTFYKKSTEESLKFQILFKLSYPRIIAENVNPI